MVLHLNALKVNPTVDFSPRGEMGVICSRTWVVVFTNMSWSYFPAFSASLGSKGVESSIINAAGYCANEWKNRQICRNRMRNDKEKLSQEKA